MTVDRDAMYADPESSYYGGRPSKRRTCCMGAWFLSALFFAISAILLIRFDLLEITNTERIRVRPGFPAFEKWKRPSTPIVVKIYLFGVTNSEAFLNKTDDVLKLEEIGPIVYHKYIVQKDIVFHEENSTMSFTTDYEIKYPEEENIPGIMNRSLIVPNPLILGFASIIKDRYDNFLVRNTFNSYVAAIQDHIFLNRTVYENLWNLTSPVLEKIKDQPLLSPFVPRANAGLLFNSFYPTSYRYNVNIGTKHGFKNFFKINTLNGNNYIPAHKKYYNKKCPYGLKGASEGTSFPPYLSKEDKIYAFTNNLPRTYDMVFNKELEYNGFDVYEYRFTDDLYKRDHKTDCLGRTGAVYLPDGLIDTSMYTFDQPIALSPPHFYGFDGEWNEYLQGLNPNKDDHESYMIIEPKTGVQFKALARIQSNLVFPKFSQSTDVNRFSSMIVPQMWMEYGHNFDDALILSMAKFVLVYMPIIEPIFIMIFLFMTFFSVFKLVLTYRGTTIKELLHSRNKEMTYPPVISTAFNKTVD